MELSKEVVKAFAVVLCVTSAVGCVSGKALEAEYLTSPSYQGRPEITESLFASDQAVLGNEEIQTLLTSKITLPQEAHVAILRFGEQFRESVPEVQSNTAFMERLQACPRLRHVSLLPALLVPDKKTVPHLREAAARYQADLLLVYQSRFDQYYRYRTLRKDEAKARCSVEAILLDVRTGVVPFSSVVTEEYVAKESETDFSFSETVDKAEQEAVGRALLQLADDLNAFLTAVP